MDLFARIDESRRRFDVLQHPFYLRWTAGELTRRELGFYAGEYRHAVVAVAEQAGAAARAADGSPDAAELAVHAAEEAAHVGLWDRFGRAVGAADGAVRPRAETARCRAAWTAGDGLLDRLAILYAVESAQPAIARTKLDGLAAHYGIAADDAASDYFSLHAELDHEHAAQARRLISDRIDAAADAERLAGLAEAALAANWELLDGVEARFGR